MQSTTIAAPALPFYAKPWKLGKAFGTNLLYLARTSSPWSVIWRYVDTVLFQRSATRRFCSVRDEFRASLPSYKFSNDWFTGNIPQWLKALEETGLSKKGSLRVLEIGSWEGLSSLFVLRSLHNAQLTCVDTWEGADEHKSLNATSYEVLSNIERNFDANLAAFKHKLTKFKGTSFSYFVQADALTHFDLIYVDGSHYCDDVMVDALKGFALLKVGGVMIFDDYLWRYYPCDTDNPAAAINSFLRLKKGSYRIVRAYYQLIIQKTASR